MLWCPERGSHLVPRNGTQANLLELSSQIIPGRRFACERVHRRSPTCVVLPDREARSECRLRSTGRGRERFLPWNANACAGGRPPKKHGGVISSNTSSNRTRAALRARRCPAVSAAGRSVCRLIPLDRRPLRARPHFPERVFPPPPGLEWVLALCFSSEKSFLVSGIQDQCRRSFNERRWRAISCAPSKMRTSGIGSDQRERTSHGVRWDGVVVEVKTDVNGFRTLHHTNQIGREKAVPVREAARLALRRTLAPRFGNRLPAKDADELFRRAREGPDDRILPGW